MQRKQISVHDVLVAAKKALPHGQLRNDMQRVCAMTDWRRVGLTVCAEAGATVVREELVEHERKEHRRG